MVLALTLTTPDERIELDVAAVYREHVDYVVRAARGYGVQPAQIEDVVQDVFMTVHRKLDTFEARSSLRTWITGILIRVLSAQRRRKSLEVHDDDAVAIAADKNVIADERIARSQAASLVSRLLEALDDDKRMIFVLAEIEEVPITEVAEALGIPLNTAYSRLRLARKDFEAAAQRIRTKDEWRLG